MCHPKPRQSSIGEDPCNCLLTIVTLLEKLENVREAVDKNVLDFALAVHKTSLGHCRAILRCGSCISKPEYFKLLALVSEKLVTLCEMIVNYSLQSTGDATKTPPGVREKQQRMVSFGQYRIDQQSEMDCVTRVLVSLQIRALWSLLVDMKKVAPSAEISKLSVNERRLEVAIERAFGDIEQSAKEGNSEVSYHNNHGRWIMPFEFTN